MPYSVSSLLPGRRRPSLTGEQIRPDEELDEDVPEAEEAGVKLVDRELQDWALLLWFFILFCILYALHAPVSCSNHTEEQTLTPSRCNLVGDSSGLRLLDYCWWPCAPYLRTCLLLSVSLGVIAQAAVVILNHEGCSRCLRLRWHFDLSDLLGHAADEGDKKAKSLLFKLTHPIEFVRNMSVQRFIHQATTNLRVGSLISRVSMLAICNSTLQTAFFLVYSISTFGSFFECTDKEGYTHHVAAVRNNYCEIIAAGAGMFLQLCCLWLVAKAEWTKQIKVWVEDEDTLFNQFKRVTNQEGPERYFPLETPPGERYKFLKRFYLMELVYVELDGLAHRPRDLGSTSGDVTLHFKQPTRKQTPEGRHRIWALLYMLVGIAFFFFASQSCWTCVKGIKVHPELTVFEVDKMLVLLGACGRHDITGFPCWLACIALFIASTQQVVVMFASKVQERSSTTLLNEQDNIEEVDWGQTRTGASATQDDAGELLRTLESDNLVEQQLTLDLVDMRRTRFLEPEFYRDAEEDMPSVPCHIWVMGRQERPMDCSKPPTESRWRWVRSRRPRKVKLLEEPDNGTKLQWIQGLARIEYNPPIQCIEFTTEGQETLRQVVPPEFIAGHFHAWVVLGPRDAWEKFSIGLACGAIMLAVSDIIMFFIPRDGRKLSHCHEVLNGQCLSLSLDPNDKHLPIEFRMSVGVWAAGLGALFSLLGALGLRVCIDSRTLQDSDTSSFRLYVAAFMWGWTRLLSSVSTLTSSFFLFVAKSCRRRLVGPERPRMKRGTQISMFRGTEISED